MIQKSIFREYDIRGIFESELNEQSVKLIGYFLGLKIKKLGGVVAIGYDARTHSPILRDYLASGLNHAGCMVLDMDMVATPVNYFVNFVQPENIDKQVNASIMITGSHNPSEYNGFKITVNKKPFFGEDIYALGDEIIANQDMPIEDDTATTFIDTKKDYIDFIIDHFSHLKGMEQKIILDCGNGVAGTVVTDIFDALELNYTALFVEPDGTFPNHHPDPTEEHNLVDIKRELKGDFEIGFAYDGDADRIAVLTKKHNIKGDILAILLSSQMENPTVIGEVKCSSVMYDTINQYGKAVMYKTGHSNLKVKMKEENAQLACEVSGHVFFGDRYFGFDDAIYATLRVLELINNGMDLDSEIEKLPVLFSTEEIKVKTTESQKFAIIAQLKTLLQNPPVDFPAIKSIIDVDGVRVNFADGWGLVRASNTTPVLVTRFESTSNESAKLYEEKLNDLIIRSKEMI
ncbi:MAG: phosphomannomutase/phosphoglucomutase [Sulfurovaceae bacterium]